MEPDANPEENSRRLVYFAAERTLTSWIRTALSLMTLGFVIDNFDLVLRRALGAGIRLGQQRLWRWTGATMVAAGIAMAVVSGLYYLRFAVRYRRTGSTAVGRSLTVGAICTLGLGAIGLVLLITLIYTLG